MFGTKKKYENRMTEEKKHKKHLKPHTDIHYLTFKFLTFVIALHLSTQGCKKKILNFMSAKT